jgi:anti-anti-sigma regulatory factor
VKLRIDVRTRGETTIIRISGVLSSSSVRDLRERLEGIDGDFELDLAELIHLDPEAAAFLRRLQAEGVELRGSSPYVRLQLEGNNI